MTVSQLVTELHKLQPEQNDVDVVVPYIDQDGGYCLRSLKVQKAFATRDDDVDYIFPDETRDERVVVLCP